MLSDEDSFFRSTKTLKGPIFGAFGTLPATDRVNAYGNIGFAILDFGPTSTGAKRSSQGFSAELGTPIKGPRIRVGEDSKDPGPWGFWNLNKDRLPRATHLYVDRGDDLSKDKFLPKC